MCDCSSNTKLGKYLGKVGSQLGDRTTGYANKMSSKAAKKFRSFTGLGDYKVSYNSLVTGSSGSGFNAVNVGRALIVSNKEYLGDVGVHPTVVGQFNLTNYTINPGNMTTFPWLNVLALQYDQYKPMGIVFEFRTTTTDSTTNSAIGSIIMSTEYDVMDSNYGSKQDMLNSSFSNESKMSEDCVHGLECDPNELSRKIFFVKKAGTSSANLDIRDYDMARFSLATQGGSLAAGTIIGSLYVHYEFAFYKEQLFGGIKNLGLMHTMLAGSTAIGAINLNWLFGGGIVRGLNMGITCVANVITIPRRWAGATFCMKIYGWSTNSANFPVGAIPVVTFTRCTRLNLSLGPVPVSNWIYYAPNSSIGTPYAYVEMMFEMDAVMALDATIALSTNFPFDNPGTQPFTALTDFTIVNNKYYTELE